jgi:predicted transcriptional regulator
MNEGNGALGRISLTVEIASAFVTNNSVKSDDVAQLIRDIHGALAGLGDARAAEASAAAVFTPAVTVRKSLASRDHILSLIDGRPYKVLTRHLRRHELTPAQYRERYDLPKSYPMVAPAFSEARRATALRIGLGNRSRAARPAKVQAPAIHKAAPKKRGRPLKGS